MVLSKVLALTVEWRPICKAVYFPRAKDKGAADDHQWLKRYGSDTIEARMVMQTIQ
jgi:hypothetical protein